MCRGKASESASNTSVVRLPMSIIRLVWGLASYSDIYVLYVTGLRIWGVRGRGDASIPFGWVELAPQRC